MGPKRKSSSAALTNSIYNISEAASSKKRLTNTSQSSPDSHPPPSQFLKPSPPFPTSISSSIPRHSEKSQPQSQNLSPEAEAEARHQPFFHNPQAQPQNMSYQSTIPPSPSLENIVTDFTRLTPSSIPPSTTSGISSRRSSIQHHSQPQPQPQISSSPKTYLILGASRGIGLEFARSLLLQNHQVIAVVRNPQSASLLWQVTGQIINRPGSCIIEQCDVSDPNSISAFVDRMKLMIERGGSLDTIILNAGILEYQKGLGSLDVSFEDLERHFQVNCVGNVVLARKLVMLNEGENVRRRRELSLVANMQMYNSQASNMQTSDVKTLNMQSSNIQAGQIISNEPAPRIEENVVIGRQIVFMSSDSGSMADFREYEDGFAAYGASKVALNMMIRHMAVELRRMAAKRRAESRDWQSKEEVRRWEDEVCVLAMHPGEVSTDMANIEVGWDVEGVIGAEESVRCMLGVLGERTVRDSGTFWRWDGTQHPW